jgi:hypothetical protein
MKGDTSKSDPDVLRDCWHRWTAIVELFARGRGSRHRLDACAYADLRRELIAVCRSLAQADGPERRFYAGLEETVNPWLYLRVFESADKEILAGLLLRCREVERKLNGTQSRLAWLRHWRPTMAIVAGGAVIGSVVWHLLAMADLPVIYTLRDSADTIWLTIKSTDDWQKGCAIAVLVVVGAMFIVSRSAKK